MSVRLIDGLATTDALADLFSDPSVLRALLDVEAALARAAAQAGAIPPRAVEVIVRAASSQGIDPAAIARDMPASGTPAIALVDALRDAVRAIDRDSAGFVHWGATSQDVSDSALLVLLRRAHELVAADHARLDLALRRLSDAHAGTVMLGRTLLQPATPITFGLKAAGWCAAIGRSWARLTSAWQQVLVVQFGGAAGTRAAAGAHASKIADAFAAELGLAAGPPWHTDRDRLGALIASCGLHAAALGKTARDITLLMQEEVGEVAERGGSSSTMPHKRNPAGCAVVLAAAARLPGLVSTFLTAMVQEHERGVGGWHAEWPVIAAAVQTTGVAAATLADVIQGLEIDTARMRRNIEATRGVVFAERAVMLLAPRLGRDEAQTLVSAAVAASRESGQAFADALRATPRVAEALAADVLADIDRPESYLGDAEVIRRQLLAGGGSSA